MQVKTFSSSSSFYPLYREDDFLLFFATHSSIIVPYEKWLLQGAVIFYYVNFCSSLVFPLNVRTPVLHVSAPMFLSETHFSITSLMSGHSC